MVNDGGDMDGVDIMCDDVEVHWIFKADIDSYALYTYLIYCGMPGLHNTLSLIRPYMLGVFVGWPS